MEENTKDQKVIIARTALYSMSQLSGLANQILRVLVSTIASCQVFFSTITQ